MNAQLHVDAMAEAHGLWLLWGLLLPHGWHSAGLSTPEHKVGTLQPDVPLYGIGCAAQSLQNVATSMSLEHELWKALKQSSCGDSTGPLHMEQNGSGCDPWHRLPSTSDKCERLRWKWGTRGGGGVSIPLQLVLTRPRPRPHIAHAAQLRHGGACSTSGGGHTRVSMPLRQGWAQRGAEYAPSWSWHCMRNACSSVVPYRVQLPTAVIAVSTSLQGGVDIEGKPRVNSVRRCRQTQTRGHTRQLTRHSCSLGVCASTRTLACVPLRWSPRHLDRAAGDTCVR